MILLENENEFNIDIEKLDAISKYLNINRDIELIITNNENIKKLNKEYRGINKATDVLSFPLDMICDGMPIGSIIISADKVIDGSEEFGHSFLDEFKLLLIHGLLHLTGYDHEIDNGEMRNKEMEIINKFNLPKSLIIRVEG